MRHHDRSVLARGLAFTVLLGTLASPALAATFWLEAESAQFTELELRAGITSPLLIKDDPAASHGSYVEVEGGHESRNVMPAIEGVATYAFRVETPGTFRIWARTMAPDTGSDSFWLRMDEGAPIRWNGIPTGRTWSWSGVRREGAAAPVTFALAAGVHHLRVAYREEGTRLDALVVTDKADFDPTAPLTVPPGTPQIRTTSEESTPLHVLLSWDAVPGADSYTILRDGVAVAEEFRAHQYFDELRLGTGCYEVLAVGPTGTSPRPGFCETVTAQTFLQRRGMIMSLTPPLTRSGPYLVAAPGTRNSLAAPPARGRARYDFRIATSTLIKVWAMGSTEDPSRDSFWVRMDSGPWIKWNNIPRDCDDVHDSDAGGREVLFHVLPGSHRLEFAHREVGATLDSLALAELDEPKPCQD